jgi:hypothetical protein
LVFRFSPNNTIRVVRKKRKRWSFNWNRRKEKPNNEAATVSVHGNAEEFAGHWRRNMPSAGERPFLLPFCGRLDKKEGA